MKIALVTDAWHPQVNGVVTTLVELVRHLEVLGHEVHVIHPGQFRTRPCPGYAGIDLAVRPAGLWVEPWTPYVPTLYTLPRRAPSDGPPVVTVGDTSLPSPRHFTRGFLKS
ncbi:MAG: glycosyl transferase, group 1 [uncultured bacterium]|nr:MAG: glycosyl transferase, group 1 [uncultured bacterium]